MPVVLGGRAAVDIEDGARKARALHRFGVRHIEQRRDLASIRAGVPDVRGLDEDPGIDLGTERIRERARRELLATGATTRKRTVETSTELTAQEKQVARLAVDGLSNPEIGARLFISPSTVQYHLRKVFMKLGIKSRTQLHQALPGEPNTAHQAPG